MEVPLGVTVLEAEIRAGLEPDAPCGGQGSCGKCLVKVNGICQIRAVPAVSEVNPLTGFRLENAGALGVKGNVSIFSQARVSVVFPFAENLICGPDPRLVGHPSCGAGGHKVVPPVVSLEKNWSFPHGAWEKADEIFLVNCLLRVCGQVCVFLIQLGNVHGFVVFAGVGNVSDSVIILEKVHVSSFAFG